MPGPSTELTMPEQRVAEIEAERPAAAASSSGSPSRQEAGKADTTDDAFVNETAERSPGSGDRQGGGRDAGAPDADDRSGDADEKRSQGIKGAFKKHPIAILVCGGLIVIGVIGGVIWYLYSLHYESTDDAFIDARPVLVAPQVTGNIISVNVTDDQIVKKDDLLIKIDPRDYLAALHQADAQVKQAVATIANLEAQIAAQQDQIVRSNEQVSQAQATLKFAEEQNTRYQGLAQTGSGTIERAQQAASDLKSNRAALNAAIAGAGAAQRQIEVLKTQMEVTAAQRDQYIAQRDRAAADLSRTELRATVDGRIARLTAQVGNLATPAQSVMVVVPLDVWVTANFKETQLAAMRVGQPVNISIDAYGRSYPGHVVGIQAGSGTAFSLLPAENATGNYVKVVQRVPVKITFDRRPDVELGPGMSVVPTVTVRP
jgi:membrane fusion protein, multidrug efflux system